MPLKHADHRCMCHLIEHVLDVKLDNHVPRMCLQMHVGKMNQDVWAAVPAFASPEHPFDRQTRTRSLYCKVLLLVFSHHLVNLSLDEPAGAGKGGSAAQISISDFKSGL